MSTAIEQAAKRPDGKLISEPMPTPFAPRPRRTPSALASMIRSPGWSLGWMTFVLALALLTAGHTVVRGGQPARAPVDQRASAAAYDLEADEAIGGHTIERHVGKTDRELADRLRREPQISAASTYTDLATARRVVGAALAQSRSRVQTWAGRSGPRPNLVVNYTEPGGRPIGRALRRGGGGTATAASRALVVLRWQDRSRRWYVLTSYPEAR